VTAGTMGTLCFSYDGSFVIDKSAILSGAVSFNVKLHNLDAI